MKKITIGILAHVDAGKTTLAEGILYHTGALRRLGRVDHGDTALDTHALERERGITIFASQASFTVGDLDVTLLDTPGHVDFSAETERIMQVLDYAILVISGTDGVQAHTRTLARLLALYRIPTFLFVTKMDFARRSEAELIAELRAEFGDGCISFRPEARRARDEALAMCRESLLDIYLETGRIPDDAIRALIRERAVFPCYFGSGLKLTGIGELLDGLAQYAEPPVFPDVFGARVFKISYDPQGNRLTHLRVTGGRLKVREVLTYGGRSEKVSQLRVYAGARFTPVEEMESGGICAVLGLSATQNGQGLGYETAGAAPVTEPVMNYRILLPNGCDAQTFLPKLHRLAEEDPQLHLTWDPHLQEIHVGLMGDVQAEILKCLIRERFQTDVEIDSGRVLYKETIRNCVEGVGHYEPLRHYAEVHLRMEPLPRGSGLVFATECSEDALDRNWQRLIQTHLAERTHLGVLTGSPITDIKLTLTAGRAHPKHTEGGDFRQATYRAVRQGLMQAESVLLEPYYTFRLEVPAEQIGRAINDIRARSGTFDAPVSGGAMTLLCGRAPVASLNGYAAEIAAYTGGRGRFSCEVAGYDVCHDSDAQIAAAAYDPEADPDHSPDSIFCAHGAGFPVKWHLVPQYMHLESCLKKPEPVTARLQPKNLYLDDKELEAIMTREFGPIRRREYAPARVLPTGESASVPDRVRYLIVDGYNVIFAWPELHALADSNLDAARSRLMHILCNYGAFAKYEVVLVFDAYRVADNPGRRFDFHNIHVVYTAKNETGDLYIEKRIAEIGKNDQVRVVTSDGLIQLSAVRSGVLRMSAMEFRREAESVSAEIHEILENLNRTHMGRIGERLCAETNARREKGSAK